MSEEHNYGERQQAVSLLAQFFKGTLSRPELVSTLALMSEDTLLWALDGELQSEALAMHQSLVEGRMAIVEDWDRQAPRVKVGRKHGFTHWLASAVFRFFFWRDR